VRWKSTLPAHRLSERYFRENSRIHVGAPRSFSASQQKPADGSYTPPQGKNKRRQALEIQHCGGEIDLYPDIIHTSPDSSPQAGLRIG